MLTPCGLETGFWIVIVTCKAFQGKDNGTRMSKGGLDVIGLSLLVLAIQELVLVIDPRRRTLAEVMEPSVARSGFRLAPALFTCKNSGRCFNLLG